jgi:hypothetical protein
MVFHSLPINTPSATLIQFKLEEINPLYSQDIILYSISQADLISIIGHLPSRSLFDPEINQLILNIMWY